MVGKENDVCNQTDPGLGPASVNTGKAVCVSELESSFIKGKGPSLPRDCGVKGASTLQPV